MYPDDSKCCHKKCLFSKFFRVIVHPDPPRRVMPPLFGKSGYGLAYWLIWSLNTCGKPVRFGKNCLFHHLLQSHSCWQKENLFHDWHLPNAHLIELIRILYEGIFNQILAAKCYYIPYKQISSQIKHFTIPLLKICSMNKIICGLSLHKRWACIWGTCFFFFIPLAIILTVFCVQSRFIKLWQST